MIELLKAAGVSATDALLVNATSLVEEISALYDSMNDTKYWEAVDRNTTFEPTFPI